ncbi:MAG: isopentenyl-diphosphate Delta-isomerase [Melioribacteraceae bacterium]|nr:MAG: isopentenyl-diphosphate Delta-isomerase [Melioribacteraceae bacterium]
MFSDVVSFDDEKLILVDEQDNVVGYKDKLECHLGSGVLHRAFSIFLFNDKGELLLQQRAKDKMLWGGFWSNTVCSHPRKGETAEFATQRRLKEEMGITTELKYIYKFIYTAKFGEIGSENENCYVYVGNYNGEVKPNPTEIADWKWISKSELNEELKSNPQNYTPWFKMEWEKLNSEYESKLKALRIF